jgi:hypothetical protein
MPTSTYVVLAIYVAFGLLELFRTRLFSKNEQTRNDGIVEVISTILLLVITQPAILIFVDYALGALRPEWRGMLSGINIFLAIGLFLIVALQYAPCAPQRPLYEHPAGLPEQYFLLRADAKHLVLGSVGLHGLGLGLCWLYYCQTTCYYWCT